MMTQYLRLCGGILLAQTTARNESGSHTSALQSATGCRCVLATHGSLFAALMTRDSTISAVFAMQFKRRDFELNAITNVLGNRRTCLIDTLELTRRDYPQRITRIETPVFGKHNIEMELKG